MFITICTQPLFKAYKHIYTPRQIADMRSVLSYLKENQEEGDILYLNNSAQYAYNYYVNQLKFDYVPDAIGMISDQKYTDDEGDFVYLRHLHPDVYIKVYAWNHLAPEEKRGNLQGLTRIQGQGRAWILFSETEKEAQNYFLTCLNQMGAPKVKVKGFNATLYLYLLN